MNFLNSPPKKNLPKFRNTINLPRAVPDQPNRRIPLGESPLEEATTLPPLHPLEIKNKKIKKGEKPGLEARCPVGQRNWCGDPQTLTRTLASRGGRSSEFRSTSKGRAYYFFRPARRSSHELHVLASVVSYVASPRLRWRASAVRPLFDPSSSFFFLFLFFARGCATLPGPRFYARWMEQVKRPLQLSHSCRLCPTYIRDEPLSSVHVHVSPVRVCAMRAHARVDIGHGLKEW